MLDRKMNTMAQHFGAALITLENKVTTEIQQERQERNSEAQLAEKRIDKVIERLEKLEKREEESPSKNVGGGGSVVPNTWVPRHLILGACLPMTPRETIEAGARKWLGTVPVSVRCQLLALYAPKVYGNIMKCKAAEGRIRSAAWEVVRWMETQNK